MLVGGGLFPLGGITAFARYSAGFYDLLRWFTNAFNHGADAIVAAESIFFVLDAPRENAGCGVKLSKRVAAR